MFLISF